MKIKFLGATGEVTGSNYLVESGDLRFFIDCGIHQGRNEDEKNRDSLPLEPYSLDAIFLTHAHMDHSGRIPYLVRKGFKGKIWTTSATADLLGVLWYDSAHLMKEEAEWKNRKNSRKGLPLVEPLYNDTDVTNALALLEPIDYDTETEPFPGVVLCFHEAGHILGSSSISLKIKEEDKEVKAVFSGDLGPQATVLAKKPAILSDAHYVLIESTYGDRLHKDAPETRAEFREVISCALKDKGKVLIPSFVVDRAQRLLYELLLMQLEGLLPENLPIFFDSPMGVKATEIYRHHVPILSDEIKNFSSNGHDIFGPKGLTFVSTVEQSRKINEIPCCIVIAGSGMCTGGRIVHHLKHAVWNPRNHVVFVGYQGHGTLGRRLIDGENELKIAGEEVKVAAQIHTIGGFSSHGDRDDLLSWASNFKTNPLFFVTHGEPSSSAAFSKTLEQNGLRSLIPVVGQEFLLSPDEVSKAEPAVPDSAKDEFSKMLTQMEFLIGKLRLEIPETKYKDELLPLLLSSQTLLETARNKAKNHTI